MADLFVLFNTGISVLSNWYQNCAWKYLVSDQKENKCYHSSLDHSVLALPMWCHYNPPPSCPLCPFPTQTGAFHKSRKSFWRAESWRIVESPWARLPAWCSGTATHLLLSVSSSWLKKRERCTELQYVHDFNKALKIHFPTCAVS